MFLSSKRPQLLIGVRYVSIRARKQNFQQNFFCGPEFAGKKNGVTQTPISKRCSLIPEKKID
jgi:hypothetical protein